MLKHEAQEKIRELAERNGGTITPAEVVEAAKDVTSPLHTYFTWDDSEAACKYREDEARVLIRSVRIVITTSPFLETAPAFVHDPRAFPLAGYTSVGRLRSDTDAAREVVSREFSQAMAAIKRAREVGGALGLTGEINGLLKSVENVSRRALRAAA